MVDLGKQLRPRSDLSGFTIFAVLTNNYPVKSDCFTDRTDTGGLGQGVINEGVSNFRASTVIIQLELANSKKKRQSKTKIV